VKTGVQKAYNKWKEIDFGICQGTVPGFARMTEQMKFVRNSLY
jgi:hypothetical protein